MSVLAFEHACEKVSKLAARFQANEGRYLSPNYQEAEVRKDFIDKFFIALGWDVNHDEQTNPYEQEVKVEPTVSDAGIRQLFGGLPAPVSGRDFPMSGIFRLAATETGSIRAETGSFRPSRIGVFTLPALCRLLCALAMGESHSRRIAGLAARGAFRCVTFGNGDTDFGS